MTDLISRSEEQYLINSEELFNRVQKLKHYEVRRNLFDEIGIYEVFKCRDVLDAILASDRIDAVPVVHEKDIRSSIITAKDFDEWQDRIILADESTQVCAVYYADDSERVPVVRCKDCLYGTPTYGNNYIRCAIWGEDIKNDRYCFCGKRRTVKRHE